MPPLSIAPLFHAAGVALGTLLGILLLTGKRGNLAANRWLAAYVITLALLSAVDLLDDSRLVLDWPQLAHSVDWLIFLVGPLVWMYVRRLTMHATPNRRRVWIHAIPAAVCLLLLLPFYLLPTAQKQIIVAQELARGEGFDWALLAAAAQLFGYWAACLITLRRFRAELRERFSSLQRLTFTWLTWMLAINLGMWLMWICGLWWHQSWAAWLDVLAVPLGLYMLAFFGIRQIAVFVGKHEFVSFAATPAAAAPVPSQAAVRYQKSGLDAARVPELLAHLEQLMQTEKPWLENDLTLSELAGRLALSPHHLSQLLNDSLGESFFDFINARRVAEVRRCLRDPAYAQQTILEIALGAGFNSKAAFNTAFRRHAGTTPSAYRREAAPARP
jgi:AraC-like DNA-binding protein